MAIAKAIEGERLFLRPLEIADVTARYLHWMNDPSVNQYLESRFVVQTMESLRDFVASTNQSPDNFLFGIFLKPDGEHIGNIKIGNINPHHLFADVGLIIGAENARGHGYAAEAIRLVSELAFADLGLNKLFAGMYSENPACTRAFLRAGYREIGVLKKHVLCNGRFIDSLMVEKCRGD